MANQQKTTRRVRALERRIGQLARYEAGAYPESFGELSEDALADKIAKAKDEITTLKSRVTGHA